MENFLKKLGLGVLVLVIVAGIAALGAFPLKWMINYLINPRWLLEAFGTPQISVWQAFALNYIAGSLIKGNPASSSK